jgi:uncharacterized protein
MATIPTEQVHQRLRQDNPWWQGGSEPEIGEASSYRSRFYLDLLLPLLQDRAIRRAIVLLGPRRVGKTVLVHHAVRELLRAGHPAGTIAYITVDHPVYKGLGLEDFLDLLQQARGLDPRREPYFVFFDEIQYLREWELHLKALVDSYPNLRCLASGSAAASLRLKSRESGAGRFTDFFLPPLTFYEYLDLQGQRELIDNSCLDQATVREPGVSLPELNERFLHYLNFGGYPEIALSPTLQRDPSRFVRADILDKVLLRDLPSLYGIQDIQELNYLFTTLAFNSGAEISLDKLTKSSGVAKNTVKRYLEYLEAAFLVRIIHRLDRSARRFERANFFKVYLCNPSLRSALFAPLDADDLATPLQVETAVFSQWLSSPTHDLHYARWGKRSSDDGGDGEVDLIALSPLQKPVHVVEVKWSDRPAREPSLLKAPLAFAEEHRLEMLVVTTRTHARLTRLGKIDVLFVPSAVWCLEIGRALMRGRLRSPWPELPRLERQASG